MQLNNNTRLDYSYVKVRGAEVLEILSNYFEDNFKLLKIDELLPERPERRNSVGLKIHCSLYDKFNVSFVTGVSCFYCVLLFDEDPVGYKLKENVVRPIISSVLISDNYEDFSKKSFNPTDKNINLLVKELDDFLKFVMNEKENEVNKNYFEIAYKKSNEISKFDHDKHFNFHFEVK